MTAKTLLWLSFASIIIVMLAIDFLLLGRQKKAPSFKQALTWSLIWIALSLLFNLGYWFYLGHRLPAAEAHQKALEFLSGYLVEKSLSMDNVFVFYAIFQYFAIPRQQQKRVLLYGVLGAIVMRMTMILLGSWLIVKFQWLFYVFGAILLLTGVKMLKKSNKNDDLSQNRLLILLRKLLPISQQASNDRFLVRQKGKWFATPLLITLIFVEISDLIFAVDSIPAIFGITRDPFILISSNVFAILGLRALYFLLAQLISRFHLLHYGLGLLLIFIALKMLLMPFFHVPIAVTLLMIFLILSFFSVLSLFIPARKR